MRSRTDSSVPPAGHHRRKSAHERVLRSIKSIRRSSEQAVGRGRGDGVRRPAFVPSEAELQKRGSTLRKSGTGRRGDADGDGSGSRRPTALLRAQATTSGVSQRSHQRNVSLQGPVFNDMMAAQRSRHVRSRSGGGMGRYRVGGGPAGDRAPVHVSLSGGCDVPSASALASTLGRRQSGRRRQRANLNWYMI